MKALTTIKCTLKEENRIQNGNYVFNDKYKNSPMEIDSKIFLFSFPENNEYIDLTKYIDFNEYESIEIQTKLYE